MEEGNELLLSVLIPAYNAEKTIAEIIERAKKAETPGFEKEIIVVDDCSTDGTVQVLRRIKGIKVIEKQKNYGKGHTWRLALENAKGDYVIGQDNDLEYDPSDYKKLLEEIHKGTKAVYGSRRLGGQKRYKYFRYYLGTVALTLATNLLYFTRLTDITTGYKLMRRDLMNSLDLKSDGFEIESEITAKLLRKGVKIKEVPIAYYPRSFEEGKGIRVKHGFRLLWALLKYRFVW